MVSVAISPDFSSKLFHFSRDTASNHYKLPGSGSGLLRLWRLIPYRNEIILLFQKGNPHLIPHACLRSFQCALHICWLVALPLFDKIKNCIGQCQLPQEIRFTVPDCLITRNGPPLHPLRLRKGILELQSSCFSNRASCPNIRAIGQFMSSFGFQNGV